MAINVELWQPIVVEELYASNAFLATMKNADEYVVGGSIVHIPQSGGASGVEKNRTVYPAVIHTRNDTDIVYPLDEYTTNPRRVAHADTVELSYDKMSSIIREDTGAMMQLVGDNIIYDTAKEVPATSKIATTGAASAASSPSATGNRKVITAADVRAAQKLLNKQNVNRNDRYLLIDEDMFDQLLSDADAKLSYSFQNVNNIKEGTMGRLYGFNIVSRSSVLTVDNAQTLKAIGTAAAADDAAAALFYQKNMIERALGDINVFDQMRHPNYYGDVVSFLIRAGSRNCRQDNKGYGIIYRDAA